MSSQDLNKQSIKHIINEAIVKNPHTLDIKKLSLFGSYLSNNCNENSDVDILIEFTPDAQVGFFKLMQIQRSLESHLNKSVDLLTPEQLSVFFRNEVLNQAEILYEK